MDVERIIDDIEQLQEMFEAPDIRPLSPSDLAAARSKARRDARTQPVVSAVGAVWGLLPSRVSSATTGRNRQLDLGKNSSTRTIKTFGSAY